MKKSVIKLAEVKTVTKALTISENEIEKFVNAPKRKIIRRNRNRQHSNRFWQDLRDAPYR